MDPPGQIPRSDPFQGFFGKEGERASSSPFLGKPRARRWMEVVGWGMRTGLYNYQQAREGRSGPRIRIDGRELLMMSSYDYLGLIGHPGIEEAAVEAVRRYGTGAGGVRLLTGTTSLHRALDRALSRFKGTEAALTFTSGYVANLAAIGALVGRGDRVILDERAHRSIVDACRLAGASVLRFRHNDPVSLERRLSVADGARFTLIVVEGIYSMDGDICPLPDLVALKRRYGAYLMVDEAHSFGVLGSTGRGVHEHFGLDARDVDIWMGSLSKAIPSVGGFLAANLDLIIYLQHESAPFMFSAAACPASTAAALAAIEVLQAEPWRIEALHANGARLRDGLRQAGFDIGATESAVVPVILGENEAAWRVASALEAEGILALAIVPPAVPTGRARLRLCAMATHSAEELDRFTRVLAALEPGREPTRPAARTAAPRWPEGATDGVDR